MPDTTSSLKEMHADNLQRVGLKVFADSPSRELPDVKALVPVFHSWIQKQQLPGHLLLDVHDYSHIHHGPGILLVAHEGNISFDMADGRPGLLYHRKQPLQGSLAARLKAVFGYAIQACSLLEAETALNGMRFRTDEILLIANDRLSAPNRPQTLPSLSADLSAAFEPLLGKVSIKAVSRDAKERFAVEIHAAAAKSLKQLSGA